MYVLYTINAMVATMSRKKKQKTSRVPLQVRIDRELYDDIQELAYGTNREVAPTVRAMLAMFMADGVFLASARLHVGRLPCGHPLELATGLDDLMGQAAENPPDELIVTTRERILEVFDEAFRRAGVEFPPGKPRTKKRGKP